MEPLKEYIGQMEYDVNFYAVISAILALLVTIAVHERSKETVMQWIEPCTIIFTDSWKSYKDLGKEGFEHLFVNHSMNFLNSVSGCHINTIALRGGMKLVLLLFKKAFIHVIFFTFRKKRVYRRSVLITGLSESGKTLLFSRLVSSKKVITYTSMKENIAVLNVPKKKPITVVDVPGNERLRFKYIEEFMPSARGIIFVIDSLTFQKEIRDVAGFLFTLLQEPFVHHYRIPFLIACNKQDHAVAKSAKVIQSQLEKEMNALRITQSGRLASVSSFEDKIFLGHKGKDFQFSDLKSIKVEFCECSALEPGEGSSTEILQSFWIWLSKIA